MKVVGIDNMAEGQIRAAVHAGGRFVVYQFCISVLVVSFKRASNIYFIPPGESASNDLRINFPTVASAQSWSTLE